MRPEESADSVTTGLPRLGELERRLLVSVVDVARAIFDAAAASIFLLDPDGRSLVFEAVSGSGGDSLLGGRFPASRGVAGWVLAAGEPVIVDDLATNPSFARDVAEWTGYVPRSLMAAPLRDRADSIGVLEVLDRAADPRRTLGDLEMIGMFARQAAIAIDVMRHRAGEQEAYDPALSGIATSLGALSNGQRAAGHRLLANLRELLQGAD